MITVTFKGEKLTFAPEEISSCVLSKLKEAACLHRKLPKASILKCVVTVPAYFDDRMKKATEVAG